MDYTIHVILGHLLYLYFVTKISSLTTLLVMLLDRILNDLLIYYKYIIYNVLYYIYVYIWYISLINFSMFLLLFTSFCMFLNVRIHVCRWIYISILFKITNIFFLFQKLHQCYLRIYVLCRICFVLFINYFQKRTKMSYTVWLSQKNFQLMPSDLLNTNS